MSIVWREKNALRRELMAGGWHTPDAYGNEFYEPKPEPAVYLFLIHGWDDRDDLHDYSKAAVAYVGMSARLKFRWQAHPVLQEVRSLGRYTQRWFRRIPRNDLRAEELCLIQKYDPPWNVQGKKRGAALL